MAVSLIQSASAAARRAPSRAAWERAELVYTEPAHVEQAEDHEEKMGRTRANSTRPWPPSSLSLRRDLARILSHQFLLVHRMSELQSAILSFWQSSGVLIFVSRPTLLVSTPVNPAVVPGSHRIRVEEQCAFVVPARCTSVAARAWVSGRRGTSAWVSARQLGRRRRRVGVGLRVGVGVAGRG